MHEGHGHVLEHEKNIDDWPCGSLKEECRVGPGVVGCRLNRNIAFRELFNLLFEPLFEMVSRFSLNFLYLTIYHQVVSEQLG